MRGSTRKGEGQGAECGCDTQMAPVVNPTQEGGRRHVEKQAEPHTHTHTRGAKKRETSSPRTPTRACTQTPQKKMHARAHTEPHVATTAVSTRREKKKRKEEERASAVDGGGEEAVDVRWGKTRAGAGGEGMGRDAGRQEDELRTWRKREEANELRSFPFFVQRS